LCLDAKVARYPGFVQLETDFHAKFKYKRRANLTLNEEKKRLVAQALLESIRSHANRYFEALEGVHQCALGSCGFAELVALRADEAEVFANPFIDNHHVELPASMLITGASRAGKTYAIGEFLQKCRSRSAVTFIEVVVVTLTGTQPVRKTFKEEYNATIVDPTEEFPEITRSSPGARLIVFDDLMAADPAMIRSVQSFFTTGRHHGWSCVFLTQHYFKCDHTIRANLSVNILFKQTSKQDTRRILQACQGRLDLDALERMFYRATKDKHGFLTIHTERDEVYMGFDTPLLGVNIDDNSSVYTESDDTSVISSSLSGLHSRPPPKKIRQCIQRPSVGAIAKECKSLSSANTTLKEENTSLKEEVVTLKEENATLKRKLEELEGSDEEE
jgi:hypothetical protein